MAKKTPRTKCLDAICLLARVSEADDNGYCTCVTCGAVAPWNEMQGGHFIPRGKSSYWALDIRNVHSQCAGCNGFGMKYGSAPQAYTTWMIDYYGRDFVDEMLRDQGNLKKLYKRDYEDMLKDFNEQIRFHKKRIGA